MMDATSQGAAAAVSLDHSAFAHPVPRSAGRRVVLHLVPAFGKPEHGPILGLGIELLDPELRRAGGDAQPRVSAGPGERLFRQAQREKTTREQRPDLWARYPANQQAKGD